MRRKIFSIWSVLLILVVLIAVLILRCAPQAQCTIDVKATLDGSAWTGAVQYTLTGPGAMAPTIINGVSVPTTHSGVNPGSWTCAYVAGGSGVFVNITPSATQSTTAGGTITFTLNFVTTGTEGLGHFMCYGAIPDLQIRPYMGEVVHLEDQFGSVEATVTDEWVPYIEGYEEPWTRALSFCTPVEKVHGEVTTPILNPDHHLTIYSLNCTEEPQRWQVVVDNQFGTQNLAVWGPFALAVPTQKVEPGHHKPPEGLDHFLIYYVVGGISVDVTVDLNDQFNSQTVSVWKPVLFANPVQKTDSQGIVTEIINPDAHLVFYALQGPFWQGPAVQVVNQFGEQFFNYVIADPSLLAVPSEKVSSR